jgi:acetylornithine aminotransferase
VDSVRGRGLLLAVQLTGEHSAAVAAAAQDAGLIVNPVTPDAIRLAPPLVLTQDEAADAVARFSEALERVGRQLATSGADGDAHAPGADR